MISCKRPNFVACVSLVVISLITIFYITRQDKSYPSSYVIRLEQTDNNIDCHSDTSGDALPSAEDENFAPQPNSIFFHETSCKRGLNSRQACSVESAARANPERQIIVMFSAPITSYILKNSCLAKLQQLDNIKFVRLHVAEYSKGTPLESILSNGSIKESNWRVEHTADMLRYLTLYKYGGVYLDTDMIVVKSLASLGKNWAAKEGGSTVNNAALAMSKDPIGRKVVASIISDVSASFRPDLWSYNGPAAVTRNLEIICNTSTFEDMDPSKCHGFAVYEPKVIYPLPYTQNEVYFKPGDLDEEVKTNAYMHHLWNRLSSNLKVEEGSPFTKLAVRHCPIIYETYGKGFGS